MSTHDDDLDLLLSLRVPETPPGSPSPSAAHHSPGYVSDDGSPRRSKSAAGAANMSVFRDAVKDYLADGDSTAPGVAGIKTTKSKGPKDFELEKFSGLRIKNPLLSQTEISNHFNDVRFIRLIAIRNLLMGDTISGCWATAGVLTEKGHTKVSSTGKQFSVWKFGALDESSVSVFLFGDAYTRNSEEPVGSVFALFNSSIRKDNGGKGVSLSIFSAGQIVKMGTSVDYGVCKGKRKDGVPCTMVINKRQGIYCKYHASTASQKYFTGRTELKGGNLKMAFRPQREGIYMVDPLKNRFHTDKPLKALKVLSVDGLKRALSNADKVTSQSQSQGIRFLTQVTGISEPVSTNKGSAKFNQFKNCTAKRPSSNGTAPLNTATTKYSSDAKRSKTHCSEKVIELDIVSSDEER